MRLSLLVALSICSLGLIALSRMPREIDPPDITHAETIVAYMPGTSPGKLDLLVTKPIERVLNTIPNISTIGTRTSNGVSIVTFDLSDSADSSETLGIVRDRLEQLRSSLQIEAPFLIGPHLQVSTDEVKSGLLLVTGSDDFQATREAATRLVTTFRASPHIASAEITHDQPQAVTIYYQDEDLANAGLTPPQLADFIRTSGQQFPGGFLSTGENFLAIDIDRGVSDIDSLRELPVRDPRDGSVTTLSDLCKIVTEAWVPGLGGVFFDEKPAVGITYSKNEQSSWEEVTGAINAILKTEPDITTTLVLDRGETTQTIVHNSYRTVFFSIIAVLLCVTIGLGFRTGVAASIAIATTLLGTIFLLHALGQSLNVVTLASLAIGIGLLIDNHIVIAHHVGSKRFPHPPRLSDSRKRCWQDLSAPLLVAAATTALGFLPAWLLRGEPAGYVSSLFVVVGILLFVSQVVGFSITPSLAPATSKPRPAMDRLASSFGKLIAIFLKHPRSTALFAIAMAAVSLLIFSLKTKDNSMAAINTRQLSIELKMPAGTSPEATLTAAKKLRTLLKSKFPQPVVTHLTQSTPRVYRGRRDLPPATERAQLLISFESDSAAAEFDPEFFKGALPKEASIEIFPIAATPTNPQTNGFRIFGTSEQIARAVAEHPEFRDMDEGTLVDELVVVPNLETAATQKITTAEIALGTLAATSGIPVSFLTDSIDQSDRLPVLLKVESNETVAEDRLGEAYVHRQSGGAPVALEDLATFSREKRPVAISRWNGQNVGYLAGMSESDPALIEPSLRFEEIGESAQSKETEKLIFRHLVPVGIGIVLLLLLQTRSVQSVGMIFLSVIPALLGAGLVIRFHTGFGVMPLLGVIALMGIVVNNAIVLVDRLHSEKAYSDDAVLAVAKSRFLPILLSASCAILGLLPFLFSGNDLWRPFALVMIAGLLVSTLTTLTFLPGLWKLRRN